MPFFGTPYYAEPVVPPDKKKIGLHGLAGRRLRVFVRLNNSLIPANSSSASHFMEFADNTRWLVDPYSRLRLSTDNHVIVEVIGEATSSDPSLHHALQDLGYEIGEDIREACYAFNDPDIWYPGVDEGIEPVTDEHVDLVIWALQRELNRERRFNPGSNEKLPAVPLAELPPRIKRALAERRRLRYAEYGITLDSWKTRLWSLWDIPLDPEFVTRRELRGLTE